MGAIKYTIQQQSTFIQVADTLYVCGKAGGKLQVFLQLTDLHVTVHLGQGEHFICRNQLYLDLKKKKKKKSKPPSEIW